MKAPLDELPANIADLFESERQAPRPSLEAERRVLGRVAVTLAATAAGTASLATSSAVAATAAGASAKVGGIALGIKLTIVVVSVGVAGTAAQIVRRQQMSAKPVVVASASHRRAAPVKVRPLPEVVAPAAMAPQEVPALPESVGEAPPVPPTRPSRKTALQPSHDPEAPATGKGSSEGSLTQESPLLASARERIAGHAPAEAIAVLAQHARRFPHGQLEEEREALWVQALVASGDAKAARARALEFRRHFPRSIQLYIVEAAVSAMK